MHGVFEDIPEEAGRYDVVWSQDAILHSDQRAKVSAEVWRVLKPGGYFVFTDPCQADDADRRSSSPSMTGCSSTASARFRFYRETAEALGFETVRQDEMTEHLRTHYDRVREDLMAN